MKNKGFTLIELLTVIGIISILSVVFIANYRGGNKEFALKRSAYQLAQGIRLAQEKSSASQSFYGEYQGAFGVYLEEGSNSFILFVDCDSDGIYNPGIYSCDDCRGSSCISNVFTEEFEEYSLESGVSISDISSNISGHFSVTFTPPDPTVNFTPDASEVTMSIQGEGTDGLSTRQIIVNKSGLVSIIQ